MGFSIVKIPNLEEFLRSGPLGVARGGARGGAKMNFTVLTFTRVWGIKSRVINSVDSESGRIFII